METNSDPNINGYCQVMTDLANDIGPCVANYVLPCVLIGIMLVAGFRLFRGAGS